MNESNIFSTYDFEKIFMKELLLLSMTVIASLWNIWSLLIIKAFRLRTWVHKVLISWHSLTPYWLGQLLGNYIHHIYTHSVFVLDKLIMGGGGGWLGLGNLNAFETPTKHILHSMIGVYSIQARPIPQQILPNKPPVYFCQKWNSILIQKRHLHPSHNMNRLVLKYQHKYTVSIEWEWCKYRYKLLLRVAQPI